MALFAPGSPRIKLLTVGGVPIVYLPMPDEGYPTIEWVEKSFKTELIDGSESVRRLGWVPQITFHWSAYDDRSNEGRALGIANGNKPSITDLMSILDSTPGTISVSPGPSAGGLTAQSWTVNAIGVHPGGYAKGLEIVFRAGSIYTTKVLGAF